MSKGLTTDFEGFKDQSLWMRGETPENIKEMCYQLCRQYLGGVWNGLSIDQIVIKRISGGFTNQLYYCAIDDKTVELNEGKVPQEVAIRFYGEKYFNNEEENERLNDVIIALMISQNNLGPKIYGLFKSGQIMSYHKHRNFRDDEQKNPKLVGELSRMLARIHAMDVPIKRTGNWLFVTFDKYYQLANERFDIKKLIEDCDCQTLKKYDIEAELTWLKKTINSIDSPITFTHIDFRGPNVMITEPNDRIVLCDFEYSTYGYRGYDLGTIFAEWNGRMWSDFHKLQDFPDDETIEPFLNSYIEESIKLKGNDFSSDNRNCVQNMLKEVKVFTLVSNMFYVLTVLQSNKSPNHSFNKNESMIYCDLNYKNYQHLKQMFVKQKSLQQ